MPHTDVFLAVVRRDRTLLRTSVLRIESPLPCMSSAMFTRSYWMTLADVCARSRACVRTGVSAQRVRAAACACRCAGGGAVQPVVHVGKGGRAPDAWLSRARGRRHHGQRGVGGHVPKSERALVQDECASGIE